MYGWGGADEEDPPPPPPPPPMSTAAPPQQQGQWGQEETKELIRIRGDFERDSASSPRSKTLWDAVSSEMLRRGFTRSPDQCKCKWKNLLNRYKGKETSDPADGRQCPFFDELHALFAERAKNMQRQLAGTEKSGSPRSRKKAKRSNLGPSSDEFSENEDDRGDTEEEVPPQKRKAAPRKGTSKGAASAGSNSGGSDVRELLEEFFRQQMRMEREWMETMEKRARERALFEEELRQSMERLERERLVMERDWKEREEQRRAREEIRAERRDALLTTLLNSLINDHDV